MMGNTCRMGQSDAPRVNEHHAPARAAKCKEIRVVIVDSDFTDSQVDEAVNRVMKGDTNFKINNSSDSSSAKSTVKSSLLKSNQLLANAPKKMRKVMMKKGKKSKSGKTKCTSTSSKTKSANLSSVQSSADSSTASSSSDSAKVPLKTAVPPKTEHADSSFFSSPLRLPSDSPLHLSTDGNESSSEASPVKSEKAVQISIVHNKSNNLKLSDDGSSSITDDPPSSAH